MRIIKRISSPVLGLQVGQTLSFSLLPTSIKDREEQTQEAGGHGENHQEDLIPSPWPPGRKDFRQQEATVRLIKRISSPLLGLQVGQPSYFSLLPTSIRTGRIRSRKQEARLRLIKRISTPLLGLQVGQPSSFSLLPTSIKDREDQIQEA